VEDVQAVVKLGRILPDLRSGTSNFESSGIRHLINDHLTSLHCKFVTFFEIRHPSFSNLTRVSRGGLGWGSGGRDRVGRKEVKGRVEARGCIWEGWMLRAVESMWIG